MSSFHLQYFRESMFRIHDEHEFNRHAIELFRHQSIHVKLYHDFLKHLRFDVQAVSNYRQIPFLPVSLFKNFQVKDSSANSDFHFTSSGTTGQETSKHFVPDLTLYDESLLNGFRLEYGEPEHYCFLALLPSYLEREGSSLIYMVKKLMEKSGHPGNGFYLHNHEELKLKLESLQSKGSVIFLIGVTYALLDFFEKYPMQLTNTLLLETGGMKGKRKEMIKAELHKILEKNSGLKGIHSEYGMTELLSQAYSKGQGLFSTPPWMKIIIRDLHDPFENIAPGQTGTINVIDLANIHSCAFIATQDLGRNLPGGYFEVLGRLDNSELRGCNLMVG